MTASTNLREKRNFEKTLKEARIGTLEAQYELALMYANGIGVGADVAKAIQWLQQAAGKGLSSAQFLLATRYLNGIGVERDETTALLWLGKAAAQGNAKAILRLGRFMEAPHREAALACLQQAAQAGLVEAQWAWARSILKDAAGKDARPEQLRQAWDCLIDAAEQGMAAAQNALGDFYLQGVAVAADSAQALDWYRRAAAQGSLQAMVSLERLQLAGATRHNAATRRKTSQERRLSPQKWLDAAESGDADTRYHLGLLYEMGWRVEQDIGRAQQWYRSAAQQGDARAQLALARILEAAGAFESLDWYRKSAEQGEAEAQFALARNLSSGILLAPDGFQGLIWYLRAAEQGHAAALVTVGSLLTGDMRQVAQDCNARAAALGVAQAQFRVGEDFQKSGAPDALLQAAHWFGLAARQGHPAAQCALALMYLEGRGVSRDPKIAVDWLAQAAEQGEPKAQWNLGALYASGNETAGVARNVNQALDWCHKAAEQGFAAAQATLGSLYARLERWSDAQLWLEKAVAQSDPEALFNLAVLAMQSKFPEITPQQALTYLCLAADKGVIPAQSRLGLAFAKGEGAALDAIEAHKWFLIASRAGDKAAATNLVHSEKLIAGAPLREAWRRAEEWSKARIV
jgi:hypothetical protein